jgi:hypothetical protein
MLRDLLNVGRSTLYRAVKEKNSLRTVYPVFQYLFRTRGDLVRRRALIQHKPKHTVKVRRADSR